MNFNTLSTALLGLLLLGPYAPAQAQATPQDQSPAPVVSPASPIADAPSQAVRYTAAHDSLMRLAANIRAQAETRLGYFKATKGSFGGLHRRIKSYTGLSPTISFDGTVNSPLVKQQIIKRSYGIEFEKIKYYDTQKRLVLAERYEDHLLTRLELRQFPGNNKFFMTKWLFVRGDYVMRTSNFLQTGSGGKKKSYFFSPRPSKK